MFSSHHQHIKLEFFYFCFMNPELSVANSCIFKMPMQIWQSRVQYFGVWLFVSNNMLGKAVLCLQDALLSCN